LLFAAAVYLGCIISPPSLQDDVDAVMAQMSRNMLTSGDWVTVRLPPTSTRSGFLSANEATAWISGGTVAEKNRVWRWRGILRLGGTRCKHAQKR